MGMENDGQARIDLDSAGVYFISVEDFEARKKPPEKSREPGAKPEKEQGSVE